MMTKTAGKYYYSVITIHILFSSNLYQGCVIDVVGAKSITWNVSLFWGRDGGMSVEKLADQKTYAVGTARDIYLI